jgi:hypothetical protein
MFLDKYARPILGDKSISIEATTRRGNESMARNFNSHSVEN